MHEHVTINGLWCSRELVQSLGWYVLCGAFLAPCTQPGHWGCQALLCCFSSPCLLQINSVFLVCGLSGLEML